MALVPHTPRLRDERIALADWLELRAILSEKGSASIYELAQELGIAGSGDAEDEDEIEPRQFFDHPKLDEVISEIEMREQASGFGYPFTVEDDGLCIIRKDEWADYTYTHMLFFSHIDCKLSIASPAGPIYPARLFEAICVAAAANYLGGAATGARAFHFAWPRPNSTGFWDALSELAGCLNGVRLGRLEPEQEKDEGLDVFAWRPFGDGRCNFICLFGQCATGADWPIKNPEPREFINVWLGVETTAVNPALFVPFSLTSQEWIKKAQAMIVFDRCRISVLLQTIDGLAQGNVVRTFAQVLLAA